MKIISYKKCMFTNVNVIINYKKDVIIRIALKDVIAMYYVDCKSAFKYFLFEYRGRYTPYFPFHLYIASNKTV